MTVATDRDDRAGAFRRARRRDARRAFALALPLLAFLLVTFIAPIALLLTRGVQNPELGQAMPGLAAALKSWDGTGLPDERIAAALAAELPKAQAEGTLGTLARRLNFDLPEFRSLLLKTARRLPATSDNWMAALAAMDERWSKPEVWHVLRRAAIDPTPDYLLAGLDAKVGPEGGVVSAPAGEAVYVDAFARTFWISAVVTLLCLLLGYPVAWLLANLPPKPAGRLMILVIVPFWTSLLVRTTAWYVLLQPGGVVNSLLLSLGIVSEPLALVFNRTGVLIGMTHILLPFMILAIYSVMKGISPVYMRAALSLGAHPAVAFLRIYLPQTLPGVGAGCFLVFVLAIGYYITPALLGGAGDEMISQLIAIQTNQQLNWGLAGALSAYLVLFTLVFYFIFNRLVGVDRLRFG
ncbi:ABC transporter permease [Zavarzinia sp.]|uniref:ABC transporter permease n=1 Tax=Zavarzinia sp. TaxID=2027920 RepID=UPI0035679D39